jgi:uncharacterized membrane protein (DUF485 family)
MFRHVVVSLSVNFTLVMYIAVPGLISFLQNMHVLCTFVTAIVGVSSGIVGGE